MPFLIVHFNCHIPTPTTSFLGKWKVGWEEHFIFCDFLESRELGAGSSFLSPAWVPICWNCVFPGRPRPELSRLMRRHGWQSQEVVLPADYSWCTADMLLGRPVVWEHTASTRKWGTKQWWKKKWESNEGFWPARKLLQLGAKCKRPLETCWSCLAVLNVKGQLQSGRTGKKFLWKGRGLLVGAKGPDSAKGRSFWGLDCSCLLQALNVSCWLLLTLSGWNSPGQGQRASHYTPGKSYKALLPM